MMRENEVLEGEQSDHSIGAAVNHLKAGKKVTRNGWNRKGMYIYYVPANSYPADRNSNETMMGELESDMIPYRDYVAMSTVNDEIVPWVCSQSDLLANDWVVV